MGRLLSLTAITALALMLMACATKIAAPTQELALSRAAIEDRSALKPAGMRMVDQLAEVLKTDPQRTVLVEGFTDSTGADAYNQTLSTERADAVRVALLRQGIASNRVASRGYGKANPVGSNDTAAGRQMNRRVEIVLSDDSGQIKAR